MSWEYQPSWAMMLSQLDDRLVADRPGVRDGFRRLLASRRLPPARVRVFEEVEVLGRVHAEDRVAAERARRAGRSESRVGDRGEDAVDPLGDLGRIDEAPGVEEGLAGMVRPVRVGSDDQHPASCSTQLACAG